MRKWPLVPVALAIMAGIALAHRLAIPPQTWLGCLAAGSLLAGLSLLAWRRLTAATIMVAIALAGCTGGLLRSLEMQHDWSHQCPEKTVLKVRLVETPIEGNRSWRVRANALSRGDNNTACSGSILLFLRKDSIAATLQCGDRLLLHGYPDTQRRSIYITSDHYIVTQQGGTSLRCKCEKIRQHLRHRMQQGPLDTNALGIAEALALGWRGDLLPHTQSSFRDAGIAHLLAVSGLHVGLLAGLVGFLFIWTGNERRGRVIRGSVQLVAIWLFTILTGLAPSTIRAALMFSLFIVARITGRRTPSLNLLAAAAIVTLLTQPALLYDLGWRLSYSAVAGILLAQPVLNLFHNRLWHLTIMSTAATLATLPISVSTFHRLPLYFLAANIVIVPLAGLLLGLSLLFMVLPCAVTAWPVDTLVYLISWFTDTVASLPGAVVEEMQPGTLGMAAICLAVLALLLACQLPLFKQPKT